MAASREREANPSAWSMVDESRPYISKAIEALHHLDSGNHVVGRCVDYLSQLSLVLNTLSMSKQSSLLSLAFDAVFPFPTRQHETSWPICSQANSCCIHTDQDQPNINGTEIPNPLSVYPIDGLNFQPNESLPNIDLGEFMIDQDLNFLGQFLSSATY